MAQQNGVLKALVYVQTLVVPGQALTLTADDLCKGGYPPPNSFYPANNPTAITTSANSAIISGISSSDPGWARKAEWVTVAVRVIVFSLPAALQVTGRVLIVLGPAALPGAFRTLLG